MRRAQPHDFATNTSSYFDFVEEKTDLRSSTSQTTATDWADTGKDAFVVQVMDEKTSQRLKREYFKS